MKESFKTLINNPLLAYFDSAASTQTHESVVKRIVQYYENERCNVHRGDFPQSIKVSDDCETARESVAKLINADPDQIIFTSGATHGLNMIAEWCKDVPVVIITEAEHSANILPWIAQGRTVENGRLVVLPLNDYGMIDVRDASKVFEQYPNAVLSMIVTSNVTGLTNNVNDLTRAAHEHGIRVCLDACQTLSTHYMDMKECTAEWLVASGHKMFGPTGIGFLYSRMSVDKLRPLTFGGGTVHGYNFSGRVDHYDGPMKHEPGTPNIAGILGLGVAAEWINYIGYDFIDNRIKEIENNLRNQGLFDITGIDLVYPESQGCRNVFSFRSKIHPADISAYLGTKDVAVRVGKLCAHPIVNKLGGSVLRVSTHIYNDEQDTKRLIEELCQTLQKLS